MVLDKIATDTMDYEKKKQIVIEEIKSTNPLEATTVIFRSCHAKRKWFGKVCDVGNWWR